MAARSTHPGAPAKVGQCCTASHIALCCLCLTWQRGTPQHALWWGTRGAHPHNHHPVAFQLAALAPVGDSQKASVDSTLVAPADGGQGCQA